MTELTTRILKHVVEDGDCWNWTGALLNGKPAPIMRWNGAIGGVRRFILLDRRVVRPTKGAWVATYTCGNPLCVSPEHTAWALRRTVQQRSVDTLQYHQDVIRRKNLSDKARARGKLTMEEALAVRNAEGTQRVIAAQFGVSQATVSAIKRGDTWRSYSNPFAGLGATYA